jgi:hypothetical protein
MDIKPSGSQYPIIMQSLADFPLGERPFNIRIVQIRLILIFKNHTEFFSSENIDSNYTKRRN